MQLVAGGMSLLQKVWNPELWRSRIDSPWFWFMLYGNFAIIGILIIGPKYTKRQENIELAAAGREEVARRRNDPHAAPLEDTYLADGRLPLKVPIWTLGLAMSIVVTGVGMWQLYRRPPQRPSP